MNTTIDSNNREESSSQIDCKCQSGAQMIEMQYKIQSQALIIEKLHQHNLRLEHSLQRCQKQISLLSQEINSFQITITETSMKNSELEEELKELMKVKKQNMDSSSLLDSIEDSSSIDMSMIELNKKMQNAIFLSNGILKVPTPVKTMPRILTKREKISEGDQFIPKSPTVSRRIKSLKKLKDKNIITIEEKPLQI